MLPRSPRPRTQRRGVTLIEMLVAVALLVLMMTVIVQVFQAATSSLSASRTYLELDGTLRHLDAVLRTDLDNVTARFTPPLDPDFNLGYFEYGENSFSDLQGEDADDYIRFTSKAPEGQFFTGRMYVAPWIPLATMTPAQLQAYYASQPITINSQYAEIIYFLRDGNLYRRVLLVAPDRQSAVDAAFVFSGTGLFYTGVFPGTQVSWQGVNDLSAHPNPVGNSLAKPVVLNTLGDLTNRENRYGNMRFSSDFVTNVYGTTNPVAPPAEGKPDDENGDTVPDFYPTLYAALFDGTSVPASSVASLVTEPNHWPNGRSRNAATGSPATVDQMAFPYVYPGMYSVADKSTAANVGPIHTPDATLNQLAAADLKLLNHNPLDVGAGDSLPPPGNGSLTANPKVQTWWGFPTWRETMNPNWNDPYYQVNGNSGGIPAPTQPPGLSFLSTIFLPPLTQNAIAGSANGVPNRLTGQLFTDGAGSNTFALSPTPVPTVLNDQLWKQTWEDDLIATGVRSFDVKAYDESFAGYADLGWYDDFRINTSPFNHLASTSTPTVWPPLSLQTWDTLSQTFAHEGRIPPLVNDNRPDAQWPNLSTNIGDDAPALIRLRRTWDSWSTDYTQAYSSAVDSNPASPTVNTLIGPPNGAGPPIYPSYPAPYPKPLRGLQIQIRVVDPRNERIKVLTIRQDFSDKL